jgi:hypothetical protein
VKRRVVKSTRTMERMARAIGPGWRRFDATHYSTSRLTVFGAGVHACGNKRSLASHHLLQMLGVSSAFQLDL